jgi:TM2 domain-containing membrane protein YozV
MYCTNCGLANEATARYCVRCGVALAAAAAPAAQPANVYPAGTPYAQASTDPYGNAYPGQQGYMAPTQRGMHPQQPYGRPAGNPAAATVLSVLIPGLGQLYNGEMKKGLVMFGAACVGLLFLGLGWLAVMIWSAIDAFNVASGTGNRWS